MNIDIIEDIACQFSKLESVEAVVISGSKTGLIHDEMSDFDLYIYSKEPVDIDFRKKLAKQYTDKFEAGNTFFEDGDEWSIVKSGYDIDLMYRRFDWAENEIDWVWRKHNAKIGYTTCFLHNIKTSQILFDKNCKFQKLINELTEPYPEELKNNIIDKNYPLLRTKRASYYEQIEIALKREDYVSMNHRVSALLASYFDILFAVNKQTHPGEKKLIGYVEKLCPIQPEDFKADVENVIKSASSQKILFALDKLLNELDIVLGRK